MKVRVLLGQPPLRQSLRQVLIRGRMFRSGDGDSKPLWVGATPTGRANLDQSICISHGVEMSGLTSDRRWSARLCVTEAGKEEQPACQREDVGNRSLWSNAYF